MTWWHGDTKERVESSHIYTQRERERDIYICMFIASADSSQAAAARGILASI